MLRTLPIRTLNTATRYYTMSSKIKYLNAAEATEIDEILMDPDQGGFALEQLMELAGLACAQATQRCYPDAKRVLVCCGPGPSRFLDHTSQLIVDQGNQGGDGLVAARHLFHFGYSPTLFYPKEGKNAFYQVGSDLDSRTALMFSQKLKKQCLNLDIPQSTSSNFSFCCAHSCS